MSLLLLDKVDVMFLETLLIFSALCAMSAISFILLPGHFKVNTTFRGYTVQFVVLRAKIEGLMSWTTLRRMYAGSADDTSSA